LLLELLELLQLIDLALEPLVRSVLRCDVVVDARSFAALREPEGDQGTTAAAPPPMINVVSCLVFCRAQLGEGG
jgi:hypothetical protein